jgi:hypothetical protein
MKDDDVDIWQKDHDFQETLKPAVAELWRRKRGRLPPTLVSSLSPPDQADLAARGFFVELPAGGGLRLSSEVRSFVEDMVVYYARQMRDGSQESFDEWRKLFVGASSLTFQDCLMKYKILFDHSMLSLMRHSLVHTAWKTHDHDFLGRGDVRILFSSASACPSCCLCSPLSASPPPHDLYQVEAFLTMQNRHPENMPYLQESECWNHPGYVFSMRKFAHYCFLFTLTVVIYYTNSMTSGFPHTLNMGQEMGRRFDVDEGFDEIKSVADFNSWLTGAFYEGLYESGLYLNQSEVRLF